MRGSGAGAKSDNGSISLYSRREPPQPRSSSRRTQVGDLERSGPARNGKAGSCREAAAHPQTQTRCRGQHHQTRLRLRQPDRHCSSSSSGAAMGISWASEPGSVALHLKMLPLLVVLVASLGRAEPIFLPASASTSQFKGLPELVAINETAGETRIVYYHEQIVGVVDVAGADDPAEQKLLRCELVEVYEPSESEEIIKNLSSVYQPQHIPFKAMVELMEECDKLDETPARSLAFSHSNGEKSRNGNPLLAGIVPGTKWCGTGDIAKSYHDLGTKTKVDRCCRNHDLCPVKIRAYKSRYSLANNSFFSKSHCTCDKAFFQCLKSINQVSANIIGNIYFNIAQPPCIDDAQLADGRSVKKFVSIKRQF